ncbi:MAG: hypothetical protein K2O71_01500, partial [Lachnospiraceae bacterium]|nr:hypothetical protein [Lachnospiraceae bacterium]
DISLKIERQSVSGYVVTGSRQVLDNIQKKEEQIRQSLMEQGFEVVRWNYGLQTKPANHSEVQGIPTAQNQPGDSAGTGVTRTDNLYLAARTVIKAAVE